MIQTAPLTRGPISTQLVLLALPLLAGNVLQQFYNTVDAVIVGQFVGDAAFAAVGVSGSVMNLFLFLISGGCTGVGILLSQFYGSGDQAAFRREFFLSCAAGFILSLLLILAGLPALPPLLTLLQTPAEVYGHALDYLCIIFLGFPAAFAFHLGSAVLRAVGNTAATLIFLSISMVVNLLLDLLFVAGLDLGTAGAAWATILAQALAAGLCLVYLRLRASSLFFHREDMRWDGPLLRRTGYFSFVSALQMCNLYIGKLLVQGAVNALGTTAITAYTAATRLEGFANSFGDSGAAALSVFIGQNTGAGNRARVRDGFRTGCRLLAIFGTAVSLVLFFGATRLLPLVLPADSGGSLLPAAGYLQLVACFYLFNFLGGALVGYFQGLGQGHIPVIGATGHISLRVVLSYLLTPTLGLPAVALATGLGWMIVVLFWSVLLIRSFRREDRISV